MTLYRIHTSSGDVYVLLGLSTGSASGYWKHLGDNQNKILICELNPKTLGNDGEFDYVVTDEP